jgi:hypothetical protein
MEWGVREPLSDFTLTDVPSALQRRLKPMFSIGGEFTGMSRRLDAREPAGRRGFGTN